MNECWPSRSSSFLRSTLCSELWSLQGERVRRTVATGKSACFDVETVVEIDGVKVGPTRGHVAIRNVRIERSKSSQTTPASSDSTTFGSSSEIELALVFEKPGRYTLPILDITRLRCKYLHQGKASIEARDSLFVLRGASQIELERLLEVVRDVKAVKTLAGSRFCTACKEKGELKKKKKRKQKRELQQQPPTGLESVIRRKSLPSRVDRDEELGFCIKDFLKSKERGSLKLSKMGMPVFEGGDSLPIQSGVDVYHNATSQQEIFSEHSVIFYDCERQEQSTFEAEIDYVLDNQSAFESVRGYIAPSLAMPDDTTLEVGKSFRLDQRNSNSNRSLREGFRAVEGAMEGKENLDIFAAENESQSGDDSVKRFVHTRGMNAVMRKVEEEQRRVKEERIRKDELRKFEVDEERELEERENMVQRKETLRRLLQREAKRDDRRWKDEEGERNLKTKEDRAIKSIERRLQLEERQRKEEKGKEEERRRRLIEIKRQEEEKRRKDEEDRSTKELKQREEDRKLQELKLREEEQKQQEEKLREEERQFQEHKLREAEQKLKQLERKLQEQKLREEKERRKKLTEVRVQEEKQRKDEEERSHKEKRKEEEKRNKEERRRRLVELRLQEDEKRSKDEEDKIIKELKQREGQEQKLGEEEQKQRQEKLREEERRLHEQNVKEQKKLNERDRRLHEQKLMEEERKLQDQENREENRKSQDQKMKEHNRAQVVERRLHELKKSEADKQFKEVLRKLQEQIEQIQEAHKSDDEKAPELKNYFKQEEDRQQSRDHAESRKNHDSLKSSHRLSHRVRSSRVSAEARMSPKEIRKILEEQLDRLDPWKLDEDMKRWRSEEIDRLAKEESWATPDQERSILEEQPKRAEEVIKMSQRLTRKTSERMRGGVEEKAAAGRNAGNKYQTHAYPEVSSTRDSAELQNSWSQDRTFLDHLFRSWGNQNPSLDSERLGKGRESFNATETFLKPDRLRQEELRKAELERKKAVKTADEERKRLAQERSKAAKLEAKRLEKVLKEGQRRAKAEERQRQQQKKQAQEQAREKTATPAGIGRAHFLTYRKYEDAWSVLKTSGPKFLLAYSDIPWPPPSNPLFVEDGDSLAAQRSKLRTALLRWHPDKFQSLCGNRLLPLDKDNIEARAKSVAQEVIVWKSKLDTIS